MELFKESLGKVAVTVEKGYWDKNKHYDRLTVVEVAHEFRTYISRKPVPGNIDILNRDYWIPFSSLREEITEDYKGMKKIADAVETWNRQLNAKINLLNSKLNVFIQSSEWADQSIEDRVNIIDKLIEALANTWRTGRPEVTSEDFGLSSFDPYLNIPIWWDGEKWISSKGVDVSTGIVVNIISNTLPSTRTGNLYNGYNVLYRRDLAVMTDITRLDQGWEVIILPVGTKCLVLEDGHLYRKGESSLEDLGDVF